jgi:hypothetical protein
MANKIYTPDVVEIDENPKYEVRKIKSWSYNLIIFN